ncbi:hypothetical protein KIF59_08515 [Enterobacter cloacae subsp. cloacae]|nr:hypothetical protein [Enterobacter cloacae subsp. cloacae]
MLAEGAGTKRNGGSLALRWTTQISDPTPPISTKPRYIAKASPCRCSVVRRLSSPVSAKFFP